MKVARDAGDKLRSDLTLAGRNLSIMRSSTESVTAPWLIREMAPRIASTLNYFLLHLTGAYCILSAPIVPSSGDTGITSNFASICKPVIPAAG